MPLLVFSCIIISSNISIVIILDGKIKKYLFIPENIHKCLFFCFGLDLVPHLDNSRKLSVTVS